MITNDRMIDLMNMLLDDMIDMYGVRWTINYLLDSGYTDDEIVELGFEQMDIDETREMFVED